jgi:hypothetical protein
VAAIQRQVFQRSNVTVLLVNKQQTGEDKEEGNDYNRVLGVEYNLASPDNKWTGKAYLHRSFDPEFDEDQFAHGLRIERSTRELELTWSHQIIGEGYRVDNGFVPRTGFKRINPQIEYSFYPRQSKVNQHGPNLDYEYIWDSNGKTDEAFSLEYRLVFENNSRLNVSWVNEYTFLFSEFDPSGSSDQALPEGSDYSYQYAQFEYQSDQRKLFNFRLEGQVGEFFNGNRYNIGGNLEYRIQPKGSFALNFDYNRVELPEPFSDANIWLIGPRVDLTFSRTIFFSTVAQYNNQIDNVNINARFQWRYQPVSDLFIVYTDNYFPDNFRIKNRALILKLTYWFNV